MTRLHIRCLVPLLWALAAVGQQRNPSEQKQRVEEARLLQASSKIVASVPPFGSIGPAQCDSRGTLYFHASSTLDASTILELSADGSKYKFYRLPPDLAESNWFIQFRATPSGDLRLLTESEDGLRVIEFAKDGSVATKTRLDVPKHLKVTGFASFNSGATLLLGYFGKAAEDRDKGHRYAAVFDPSGKLVKRLGRNLGTIDLGHEPYATIAMAAVGEDDAVYFLVNDQLLVVSQSGQFLRRLPVRKVKDDFFPNAIQVSGGLIAIQYYKNVGQGKPFLSRYLVLNAYTGTETGFYLPEEELGNSLVCFSAEEGFTFTRVIEGKEVLLKAQLK